MNPFPLQYDQIQSETTPLQSITPHKHTELKRENTLKLLIPGYTVITVVTETTKITVQLHF